MARADQAPGDQALADQVLDIFARETRIDRALLLPQARADELGVESLDMALALFEIEDRFDVKLPEPAPGAAPQTVGQLVQQVLDCIAVQRS